MVKTVGVWVVTVTLLVGAGMMYAASHTPASGRYLGPSRAYTLKFPKRQDKDMFIHWRSGECWFSVECMMIKVINFLTHSCS